MVRWPLHPLQPLQKTQLQQPPFGPSVDSLCHPWLTTTNLSYRFSIFETSATTLCGTTGICTVCIYVHLCTRQTNKCAYKIKQIDTNWTIPSTKHTTPLGKSSANIFLPRSDLILAPRTGTLLHMTSSWDMEWSRLHGFNACHFQSVGWSFTKRLKMYMWLYAYIYMCMFTDTEIYCMICKPYTWNSKPPASFGALEMPQRKLDEYFTNKQGSNSCWGKTKIV